MSKKAILALLTLAIIALLTVQVQADITFTGNFSDSANDVEIYDNSQGVKVGIAGNETSFLDVLNGRFELSVDMSFIEMNSTFASTPIVNSTTDYSMNVAILDEFNTTEVHEVIYSMKLTVFGGGNFASFTVFYDNGTQFMELVPFVSFINTTTNVWYANFSVASVLQKYSLDLVSLFSSYSMFTLRYYVISMMDVQNSSLYYTDELLYGDSASYVSVTNTLGNSTSSSTTGFSSLEFPLIIGGGFFVACIVRLRKRVV